MESVLQEYGVVDMIAVMSLESVLQEYGVVT